MDEKDVIGYIEAHKGVSSVESSGTWYFFYDAEGEEPNRYFPFITLVTTNEHDQASDLDRHGIYRLNIGLSKETYLRLFGKQAPKPGPDGIVDTGYDYRELDRVIPHPVYAPQRWVSVLNPGDNSWGQTKELIAEAYERAAAKLPNR